MKQIILFSFLFISSVGFTQLTGDVVVDGRKITSDISYTLEMKAEGILVFDISVDVNGKVTSCEWNKVESTVNSMRYAHEAKNRILTELKFQKGNGYPTFHRGKVVISSEQNTSK